jgi:hypothetical protein
LVQEQAPSSGPDLTQGIARSIEALPAALQRNDRVLAVASIFRAIESPRAELAMERAIVQ